MFIRLSLCKGFSGGEGWGATIREGTVIRRNTVDIIIIVVVVTITIISKSSGGISNSSASKINSCCSSNCRSSSNSISNSCSNGFSSSVCCGSCSNGSSSVCCGSCSNGSSSSVCTLKDFENVKIEIHIIIYFYTPVEDRTYYGITRGGWAASSSLSGAYLQNYSS